MNNITQARKKQIKNIVLNLLKNYGDIYLPMPVKAIAKSLPNCRVIPYSRKLKKENLDGNSISKLFNSYDACSDYNAKSNKYIIYYNDMDKKIMSSNRYRWNIAHELGHILLHHHDFQNTRLFREALSSEQYWKLENEANIFASYLLVPHVILYFQEIKSYVDIAHLCKISNKAAKIRFEEYKQWRFNSKFTEKYDRELQTIFHNSNKTQEKIFCGICKTHVGFKNNFHYCYICGNNKTRYIIEGENMLYDGIEVDNNGKAKRCPICNNEDLSEGKFCKICGSYTINECQHNFNETAINPCKESVLHPLPGNARFCPYCGSNTTFYNMGYLKKWQDIDGNSSDSNNYYDDYNENIILPF